MKYISYFTGIGGFDRGLDAVGMECVAQVEIDPQCANNVLARDWPDTERFDDVRKVSFRNGKAWKRYKHPTTEAKAIDLACGGFPCQDLSIAGRREGLAGKRSGLWEEFARLIREAGPRWVIIENVPGLLSSNGGRDFAVILQWLVKCGYGVAWRVFDSRYFGVPQRRRRVFIVGYLGAGRAAEVLFERESSSGHPKKGKEARAGIAGTSDRKSASGDRGSQKNETDFLIAGTLPAEYGKQGGNGMGEMENGLLPISGAVNQKWRHTSGPSGAEHQNLIPMAPEVSKALSASDGGVDREDRHTLIAFDARRGAATMENVSPTINPGAGGGTESPAVMAYTIQSNDGGNHKRKDRPEGGLYVSETDKALTVGGTDLTAIIQPLEEQDPDPPDTITQALSENIRGELLLSDQTNALQAGGGKPGQGYQAALTFRPRNGRGQDVPFIGVRRLMPIECERLQGFPDGHTAGQSDSARYRQLGNAVTVNVIEWIGARIMEIENGNRIED
jgi:DNA (cytosine-5)-methyltransferase 1